MRAPPTPLLAALCALPPLSIDLGLPALPAIGHALGVGSAATGLSVSLFMAGFAATPLAIGLASDRWGRRPVLLGCLALYAAGGLLCAAAPSLAVLLCGRFLEGASAASGPTIAFAATRDTQTGAALARRLALFTTLLNAAPVVAPSLGIACLALAGWRFVFALLAALGAVLLAVSLARFGETRTAGPAAGTLGRTLAALRHAPRSLAQGAAYGLGAGAMFSYVATSPMLLIGSFGVSRPLYSALFAITGGAIMAGAALSTRAGRAAPVFLVGGAAAATTLLAGAAPPLALIMAALASTTFGYGLLAPRAAHAALDPLAPVAGVAAALLTSVQMASMAAASALASLLFAEFGRVGTPLAMLGFALAATAAMMAARACPRMSPA